MTYSMDIKVRYGEVDRQGVVFNAHYLAYLDDVVDSWLREFEGDFESLGWDLMLKKVNLEWHGPAGTGEVLNVEAYISRWGNTSFDVSFEVKVENRLVLTATIVYVGVKTGTTETLEAPEQIREYLSNEKVS
ncbi:MAG: acyl-CoA thioesterase [Acidimicrobiales bacterium]|jgi:acyl-CoA thioester hydrolase|nr:acyl-CoA thioesterase [Acidimicrobiales bacterium]|tara:strand:+ start:9714 stop:10109 length:396 start_codon:yes stop_codon:yes gene_type:complete